MFHPTSFRPSRPSSGLDLSVLRRHALLVLAALVVAGAGACSGAPLPHAGDGAPPVEPLEVRGGRLFDNWRSEKDLGETFVVDNAKTAELDGKGGPHGNGTLADGTGAPMPNSGHDYRLKNLFGWDLRGTAGLYGADYHNKAYVLAHDLLATPRQDSELATWLARGGEGVPALGAVLTEEELGAVAAFIGKMQRGELPRPEAIFALRKDAPKNYRLNAGGDAARGKTMFAERCVECHGPTGVKLAIDEIESVGTLSRKAGYEIWLKLLSGQPGTKMGRQLRGADAAAQTQELLDLLAALCDRQAFPPLEGQADVADGDARCGDYLR